MTGTVKKWIEGKGYGFISNPIKGERDYFVHFRQIAIPNRSALAAGEKVEFEVEETSKGTAAVNVRLAEEDRIYRHG